MVGKVKAGEWRRAGFNDEFVRFYSDFYAN